ncbi:MAG TPA: SPOR domain-containing protein [Gemmatimonadaceae bacterium]|nr:SPOR domain-containing protein [Gemmatimonadaceae bacterium]
MNSRVSGGRPVAWEDAGRQIASLFGSYFAVVVTSSDHVAAAHVALGIARAEATHRRVVVGDLIGDNPSLRSLVRDEDPHGITDSFLYGVSLNKIGYAVEGTENLYVMPSGTDPHIDEEILRSARWTRVAAGFGEVGALLLLVAPWDSKGLGDLIDKLDGAVLVKDADLPAAPTALVLARVASPTPTLKIPLHRISARAASWKQHRWFYPALGAIALVLIASLGLALVLARVGQSARQPARVVAKAPPAPAPAPTPPPPRPPPETLYVAPPANVNDSASAAAFTVELLVANTAEGANLFVRKNGAALPAAAVSPVAIDLERSKWYKVTAGAYTRRDQADSLLRALRNSGVLRDSAGSVTTAPLALIVDSVPTQGGIVDAVRGAVDKYTARGLAVYALMQNDGGALIYAGAFSRADQSAELIRTLRGAGLKPVLVYRTGSAP